MGRRRGGSGGHLKGTECSRCILKMTVLYRDVLAVVDHFRVQMELGADLVFREFSEAFSTLYLEEAGVLDDEYQACLVSAQRLIRLGITPCPRHYMTLMEMYWRNELGG